MTDKSKKTHQHVIENPWQMLNAFTDARIGLGRAGVSVPTHHLLAFQLAHAKAQDAVHQALDVEALVVAALAMDEAARQLLPQDAPPFVLHSQAVDRPTYLQRPDLGRQLDSASIKTLTDFMSENPTSERGDFDLAIVIADGLSSLAIEQNALAFLQQLKQALNATQQTWHIAPLSFVQQGRVAVGDEVGEALKANAVLMMIGERPGLSSPDSMGLYLTWAPKKGTLDSSRNCISNVRSAGLSYQAAAKKLVYLLQESRKRKLTGVNLKERSDQALSQKAVKPNNQFLL